MHLEATVAMQFFGKALYIPVKLWSAREGEYKQIYLTFDTGATTSTLSTFVIENLGCRHLSDDKIALATASGVEWASKHILDKIMIADIEIFEVEVLCLDFPEESFSSGVIGLNVLRNFDVELLFSKGLIKFKK